MGFFRLILGIIPARGGSKGLPGKNIKEFCGKPLIAHTIDCARKSKELKEFIVSTDSIEIAEVAQDYGAEVPFLRPPELATDYARAIDNYIYTFKRLENEFGRTYRAACVLQPTSPLRTPEDIDKALEIFTLHDADSVVSVSPLIHPPSWAKKIEGDGKIKNYFPNDGKQMNRQDEIEGYAPNGAIFILKRKLLEETLSYYSEKSFAYLMPKERSLDIDDLFDFKFAELIWKARV